MEELEKTVARNLAELRRANGLTQAEFAERINYTDKSVSKWERGEAIPDVKVLKQLADLYGVTLDYFVEEAPVLTPAPPATRQERGYRMGIALLVVAFLWLAITVAYITLQIYSGRVHWLLFVWGAPLTIWVFLFFNRRWRVFRSRLFTLLMASGFCWSVLAATFLQIIVYMHINLWILFLVGAPVQAALLLWMMLQRYR